MATNLATLGIKVDPSKAISGANKAKKAISSIGKTAKKVGGAIAGIGKAFGKFGVVSAGVVTAIGYFVKKSLDATDAMTKMSRAVGVSVESLQKLRHAGNLAGLEATAVDKAVQKLAINIADVGRGTGEAKDIFDKYGISATNVDGSLRSVEEIMLEVADVTAGMTNQTERAELAYRLFGARGGKMINMLKDGSQAMKEQWEEAEKLGLVISTKTAKGVEEANDAITRLSGFLTSSFRRAIAELAPAIKDITDGIRGWVEMKVKEEGGIGEVARKMANAVINATIGIVKAFESVTNGAIDMLNNVNRIMMSLPESLGGFRDIEDVIADMNDEIMRIEHPEEYAKLQRELEAIQRASENVSHINVQKVIDTLEGYKIKAVETSTIVKNLGGDTDTNIQKTLTWTEKLKEGWDGVKGGMLEYAKDIEDANNQTDSFNKLGLNVAKGMEDAFVNMAMGVKTSFKDMARAIMADIMRIYIRQQLIAPLLNSIGGGFSGGQEAGVVYGHPEVVSGAKANGGTVTGNKSYLVGERGAEVFVPNKTGTIIPNDELGGSGTVINQTINISTGVQQTVRAEVINMLPQIANATMSAVADARQRGGGFSKAMVGA